MDEVAPGLMAAGTKVPIGEFVLDLGAEQLLDDQGNRVELRPQAWAVLRHLAMRAGRLVTKDELLEAIWPGLVVTDGSLTQAVSDVRVSLGETGRRLIKTVPKRGYLLVADAVQPPVRPLRRTNLPAELDMLVGREADATTLKEWLAQHRLITVLGAGGIGKTRLAQAVARELVDQVADGVWWVDLAALSMPGQIVRAIAMAANLDLGQDVTPGSLVQSLSDRKLLLVLDNCEHLLSDVAPLTEAILSAAPEARVLATSQQVLAAPGERVYRLDTLAVPPPGTTLDHARSFGALRLLELRAQAADSRFRLTDDMIPAATDLCRKLDGIALAVEMAAARLPSLGMATVRRFAAESLLRGARRTAPTRQQTLRATLQWSHALLTVDEQAVLRRLSVFVGSFRLDAAKHVAACDDLDELTVLDAVTALVDKSLLQVEEGLPRFRMLEPMRLFAAEQLAAADETDTSLGRHVRAMSQLATEAERSFWVLPDAPWVQAYMTDYDEMQAAFQRAGSRRDAGSVAAIGGVLDKLDAVIDLRTYSPELAKSAGALLPQSEGLITAHLWLLLAVHSPPDSDATSLHAARAAVVAWRALGNTRGLYRALALHAWELTREGNYQEAESALAEALSIEEVDWPPRLKLCAAASASKISESRGDFTLSRSRLRKELALAQQAGADRAAAWAQLGLGEAALTAGDIDEAVAWGRTAVHAFRALNQPTNLALGLVHLCDSLLLDGNDAAARRCATEALPWMWRACWVVDMAAGLALLASRGRDFSASAQLLGYAEAWYARHRDFPHPYWPRLTALAARDIDAALGVDEHRRLREDGKKLGDLEAHLLAQRVLNEAPSHSTEPVEDSCATWRDQLNSSKSPR